MEACFLCPFSLFFLFLIGKFDGYFEIKHSNIFSMSFILSQTLKTNIVLCLTKSKPKTMFLQPKIFLLIQQGSKIITLYDGKFAYGLLDVDESLGRRYQKRGSHILSLTYDENFESIFENRKLWKTRKSFAPRIENVFFVIYSFGNFFVQMDRPHYLDPLALNCASLYPYPRYSKPPIQHPSTTCACHH